MEKSNWNLKNCVHTKNVMVLETKDKPVDIMESANFTDLSEKLVYETDNRQLKSILGWAEREMMHYNIPTFEDDAVTNFLIKSVKQN